MLNYGFTIPKNDGNDVESCFNFKVFLEDVRIRRSNEHPLLLARHGDVGIAIFVGLTRLHLHDDQELAIPGDDVYLLVDILQVLIQYLIAIDSQLIDRELLAKFP